jgi:hypothetical protein
MSILNQKGNVLAFTVIATTMIAALGVGMFYMTSTSSLGGVGANNINRAYFVALAGKDYAIANWNSRLQITGNEFILSNNDRFLLALTDYEITSTGIVNKDTPFEARKTIKVPAPRSAQSKKTFFEPFENLSKWVTGSGTSELGTHAITSVGGDNALKVTPQAYTYGYGYGVWSFLQLNTAAANVDLTKAWKDAGYCLSHDLQIKIRVDNQPYYKAGLIFKASGTGDTSEFYGISYMRTKQQCPDGFSSTTGWNAATSTWTSCYASRSWTCSRLDNIPSPLKPDDIFTEPLECGSEGSNWIRYSRPSIVLWKKRSPSGDFIWLAYKLLTSNDYVVDTNNRLVDWSNVQVRLLEAYQLSFTNGGPSPLLDGDFIVGVTSRAMARVNGTPIYSDNSETWASSTAAGILTLTNISGSFQSGEDLIVNGITRAKASSALSTTKANYIRVYYGDVSSHGTPNNIPIDNIRAGNPRLVTGSSYKVHWPVDDISSWNATNDFMTQVKWSGVNASESTILGGSGTTEAGAIIKDTSITYPLITPGSGSIDHSGIAVYTTGNTSPYIYFDDFAIRY